MCNSVVDVCCLLEATLLWMDVELRPAVAEQVRRELVL